MGFWGSPVRLAQGFSRSSLARSDCLFCRCNMHTGITEIQWLIFFFQEALMSTHERRVLSVQTVHQDVDTHQHFGLRIHPQD